MLHLTIVWYILNSNKNQCFLQHFPSGPKPGIVTFKPWIPGSHLPVLREWWTRRIWPWGNFRGSTKVFFLPIHEWLICVVNVGKCIIHMTYGSVMGYSNSISWFWLHDSISDIKPTLGATSLDVTAIIQPMIKIWPIWQALIYEFQPGKTGDPSFLELFQEAHNRRRCGCRCCCWHFRPTFRSSSSNFGLWGSIFGLWGSIFGLWGSIFGFGDPSWMTLQANTGCRSFK